MKIQTKIAAIAGAVTVAVAASAIAAGPARSKYFSPNNDGIKDFLEIPFSVTDNGRIVSWKIVISNSRGIEVRTIGNKIALPQKITAKEIVKQLGKRKDGVLIPERVIWDGTMNDGTMAPDGEYSFYISVMDEDGNEGRTKKISVILDNTKPDCKLTVPEGDDLVFGEGKKGTFTIKQSGSVEKLWTGTITNGSGNIVRTYGWANEAPGQIVWDGTDDKGMIVPDGIYHYSIKGEDKAGNINDDNEIRNIIFSAEKPATNIAINGAKYFSLPGQSELSKITLDVTIPEPVSSANKLAEWSVTINDKNGAAVRTYNTATTGQKAPLKQIEFDGKDDNGTIIPEGKYFAQVKAKYLNGYETLPVNTNIFVFDHTAPSAKVETDGNIFSPDGDGRKDLMNFKITADKNGGSPIRKWHGQIVNVKNPEVTVYEYNLGSSCPASLTWNGLDKKGKLSEDGEYDFILTGEDMAGNKVTEKTAGHFALDTSKTEVMLASTVTVISPNGDGIQDSITFTPVVKDNVNVSKYNFEIKDKKGNTVYSISANGKTPANIKWDGKDSSKKLCADGEYTASLVIDSTNGSQAKVEVPGIIIDTVAPSVVLSCEDTLFSPDGDGIKDEVIIKTADCSSEDEWTVTVTDKSGKKVYQQNFNGYVGGTRNSSFAWDGSDDNGNKASDGTYSVTVNAQDAAGNKVSKTVSNIVIDTRAVKAFVTAKYEGISPLSQTGLNKQIFTLKTSVSDGIKNWKFEVLNTSGKTVYSITDKDTSKIIPKEIVWDKFDSGTSKTPIEGMFTGRLSIEYEKGNKITESSTPFLCSSKAPELAVSTSPEFFSPDNDGIDDDLFIKLGAKCSGKIVNWSFVIYNPEESGRKGKPFWTTSGTSKITEQLTWNGLSNISKEKNGRAECVQSAMEYPWEFTVTDSLGLTSTERGKISIDILVVRDGKVLKMAVPAIIFRSNAADFKTAKEAPGSKVTPEQAANNERVLKRVADVLNKFPDYTITVVGHANNISGTEEEETSTANGNIPLIPLSLSRAEFVKSKLQSYGIETKRMTTEGKGGRERIASLQDRENWWKNRRVEFLLHK
mgnify:CR=1 FL=1